MSSPALDAIADLRVAARLLLESGDSAGERVGERLRHYLEEAPRGMVLEVAVEITPVGGEPWWRSDMRATRDRILVEIWRKHFPGTTSAQAAAALHKEWQQYSRAARQQDLDRGHTTAPPASLRARLYELALLGVLPERRRIRDILANYSY